MPNRPLLVLLAVASLLFFSPSLFGEETPLPVIVNGDHVEYFPEEEKVVGEGNVSVDYRESRLTCRKIVVYLKTKEATAEGDVMLFYGDDVFTGETLTYNFDTMQGVLKDAKGKVLPWYVGGKEIQRHSAKEFEVVDGYLTTCNLPHPHYKIRTKQVKIYPGEKVVAKNVSFETGGVPFFYAPYYSKSIRPGGTQRAGARVVPGYSSRWGVYGLSAWGIDTGENASTSLHLDGRSRRGVGTGADVEYKTKTLGTGDLRTYYINDRKTQSPVGLRDDRDRYRVRWLHRWEMTPTTTFLSEVQEWSDRFMTRDYFNQEFSEDAVPDTQASLVNNSRYVTTKLNTQKRVNPFLTQTERLPELSIDSRRLPLWETGLFYRGETHLGYLTRKSADNTTDDFSTRLDGFSEISYPFKLGPLQWVPFTSSRQTYYSQDQAGEEDFVRSVYSAGGDLSTRFRRMVAVEKSFFGVEISGLRHIVEPSLQYRWIPKPKVLPGILADFDEIEAIDQANRLTFVLDQKFQTRRSFQGAPTVVDLLDFVLSNDYDFGSGGKGKLTQVRGDVELRPGPNWGSSSETTYDVESRNITRWTIDLFTKGEDDWRLDFLHRYEKDVASDMTAKTSFRVGPKWKIELFDRYDFQGHVFEEEEAIVTRDLHCWEASLGLNVRDTEDLERKKAEISVYLAFRLKAFPEAPLELGNKASLSHRFIGSRRSGESD